MSLYEKRRLAKLIEEMEEERIKWKQVINRIEGEASSIFLKGGK